jgi:molecular chaperone GrpE
MYRRPRPSRPGPTTATSTCARWPSSTTCASAPAESQPENRDHHLTDGIRLVQAELLAALARVGIEQDSPKGEPFDPHHHEAIAQQPVEGTKSGTIVEVYSQGYRYRDDVLRPAKVVVAA